MYDDIELEKSQEHQKEYAKFPQPDPLFWLYAENYRTINIDVARKLGSVNAALFLSEVAQRLKYHRDRDELHEGEWFYFTQEHCDKRTSLSRKEQDVCIRKLEALGILEKRVIGIPPRRYFKINEHKILELFGVQEKSYDMSQRDKLICPKGTNRNVPKGQIPIIYKNHREEQKYIGAADAAPPSFSSFSESKKESKGIERAKNVTTTAEQHAALEEELGAPMLAKCYERLSLWKEDTPRSKWKKFDHLAIKRWVVDAVKADDKKKKSAHPERQDTNKELAEKIAKMFCNAARQRQCRIEVLNKHIEIIYEGCQKAPICIAYTENAFIEQVESALRKIGIVISKSSGEWE